ncbi:MAG TPA: hypothetical protein VKC57_09040, partial [Ktedonobacterales bacterium]|nr:hypothetical protein [Ktedonobacterales bacterium]
RAYVEVLQRLGFEQAAAIRNEEAIRTEQKAMQFAAALGARDLSDVYMAAYYVEACSWLVSGMANLARNEEARRAGEDCLALADRILVQRPGYRLVLHAEQVLLSGLTGMAANELNPAEGLRYGRRQEQVSTILLGLDPKNTVSANNLGVAHDQIGYALWGSARLSEAVAVWMKSIGDYALASVSGGEFGIARAYSVGFGAMAQVQIGDNTAARTTVTAHESFFRAFRQKEPKGSMAVAIADAMQRLPAAYMAYEGGELQSAVRSAADIDSQLQGITPHGDFQANQRDLSVWVSAHIAGRAEYLLGDFAAAEKAEREALARRKPWVNSGASDQRQMCETATWLAMAVARQGRTAEAAQTIAPWVKYQRELAARDHGDQWLPLELAGALYAEALTDAHRRPDLLREAAGLVEHLAAPLRGLHDVQLWRTL